MAVVNDYVDTRKRINARESSGTLLYSTIVTFDNDDTDSDGSIYRIARIPSHVIVKNVQIRNGALTGGVDWDVGFYQVPEEGGAVVDADYLGDGLDLSSAHIPGSELSGISALPVEDSSKALYEALGITLDEEKEYYDLALTANTVGTVGGTVSVLIEYLM